MSDLFGNAGNDLLVPEGPTLSRDTQSGDAGSLFPEEEAVHRISSVADHLTYGVPGAIAALSSS